MLGAADTPYARSVKPMTTQKAAMPDAGLLFDTLMARRFNQEHENKISSMLFYYAAIIIHDLFRTDHKDMSMSKTSSYLDLAPLYGSNATEQAAMRTHKDGRIHPDAYSEKRLSAFPPGVSVILVMFNRFHNHVAESLAQINENGRFDKPLGDHNDRTGPKWDKRDEDLFQTARHVTVGLYVNVILYDYIRTILNLNRTDSDWVFDPRMESELTPSGVGNQVSAEFNLVYRWHSTLSEKDVAWTEKKYQEVVGEDASADMDIRSFVQKLSAYEKTIPNDPRARKLDNLTRDAKTGRFNDDELVQILTESIEDCAHSFGAHRVPEVLRNVEILGIIQARSWNLATLNEFRNFFGLKKYKTFEEINPEVANELRHLYDHPDNVELYPGLVVEQAKKSFLPGSGLMAGFSTTRGILSDATALTRGDRFLTTDYHAKNLTAWGFAEAAVDPMINNGHVAYKLFLNAFPHHFQYNSIYAHYPFTVPEENRTIMKLLNKADLYTWDEPKATPLPSELRSYDACTAVLHDKSTFNVTWGKPMQYLMGPAVTEFMLAGDGTNNQKSRDMMNESMYKSVTDWKTVIQRFYRDTCEELLKERAYSVVRGTRQIDLIRDFSNIAHVRFCAAMFKLPLKESSRDGVFTENELYLALVAVFILVFFDLDKGHSFQIHRVAKMAAEKLGQCVEIQVNSVKSRSPLKRITRWIFDLATRPHAPKATSNGTAGTTHTSETYISEGEETMLERYGWHLIDRLCKLSPGLDTKELVWGHIMGTLGGMVPNQSQGFSEMMEYFLNGDGQKYWPDIVHAATRPDDDHDAQQKLVMYVMEGTRIACASGLFRKVNKESLESRLGTDPRVKKDAHGNLTIDIDDGKEGIKTIAADTEVFVNLYQACHDDSVFDEPEECKTRETDGIYPQFGFGPHKCLGFDMIRVAFVEMLRAIAKRPELQPVAGLQGQVKKIPTGVKNSVGDTEGFKGYNKYMTENWDSFFPFPVTMKVQWDDSEMREEVEAGVVNFEEPRKSYF